MSNIIVYTNVEQQIEKLKKQGLIINDEEFAKRELQLYGYSNLIKSYRVPYTYSENGQKLYRSGITFERIWSLYMLDKNLRNAVMGCMLDLEELIKESAADVLADSFGIDQNQYLMFKNFSDKKKHKKQFTLSSILTKMKNTLNTTKDPISHYMQKYAIVPPWILFKSIYFSDIVNFINLFKPAQREMLIKKLYNTDELKVSADELPKLMIDSLFICLEYRNLAAHGGRIYNHTCKSRLRFAEDHGIPLYGISELFFVLTALRYSAPLDNLNSVLSYQINRHCGLYPEDTTYLAQLLNLDISAEKIVWTTKNSSKYHLDPHCSGIKNAIELPFTEAEKQGLIPCKKCCK